MIFSVTNIIMNVDLNNSLPQRKGKKKNNDLFKVYLGNCGQFQIYLVIQVNLLFYFNALYV